MTSLSLVRVQTKHVLREQGLRERLFILVGGLFPNGYPASTPRAHNPVLGTTNPILAPDVCLTEAAFDPFHCTDLLRAPRRESSRMLGSRRE